MKNKGFKLIQTIGCEAMKFKSTGFYTLSFEESKQMALTVLKFIRENGIELNQLEKEVEKEKI